MQRKNCGISAANFAPFVLRSNCVCSIFQDRYTALCAECANRIDIHWSSGIMHRDDQARSRGDCCFDRICGCEQGVAVDINENISRAAHFDHIWSRDPSHGWSDDFVARTDSHCLQSEVHQSGAGCCGDCFFGACAVSDHLFQLGDARTGCDPSAAQNITNCGDVFLGN